MTLREIPHPMSINRDLREALDRVIMRALARERSDRYASARELRARGR